MSENEVRELGRRFVEEYAGGGDIDSADRLLADDFVAYAPAQIEPLRGRENHKKMNASWHAAFPDFDYTLESVVADGDQVVVRFSWEATHTGGELMGVPPAGHRVKVTGEIHWLEAAGGRLVKDHVTMDLGNIMNQLKGLPIEPEH